MGARRWVGVTLLLWLVACGLLLGHAGYNLLEARRSLEPLRGIDPVEVDSTAALASLQQAEGNLEGAVASLESPIVKPLDFVPVLGRQLRSTRAIAATTRDVSSSLIPLLVEVEATRSDPSGIDRIAALRRVSGLLGDVRETASDADLGPDQGLVSPLASARAELSVELVDLETLADDGAVAAAGLASFLGDGDYLLLGGNNAEMRVGFGMFLSLGVLEARDGQLTLPGLTPAKELAPVPFDEVLDRDVADRWGFVSPGDDYRKVGYSARFSEYVAPQVLAMWEAQTGQVLDGVVYLDPFALQALMTVLGPVTVDGNTIDAETALSYMLETQYEVYQGEELVDDRQDVLSAMAGEVATEFGKGEWDPIEVIRAMEPVAADRHLMVYSKDPTERELWERLEVDGGLDGREVGAFVINNGASKLDPFLDVDVDIETTIEADHRHVTMVISAKNNATSSLNEYALGPWASIGLPRAGVYLGRFVAYAPALATNVEITSPERTEVFGPDGQVWVVATEIVQISPGAVRRVTVEFDLPLEEALVEVLPGGRFPAQQWRLNGELVTEAERHSLGG